MISKSCTWADAESAKESQLQRPAQIESRRLAQCGALRSLCPWKCPLKPDPTHIPDLHMATQELGPTQCDHTNRECGPKSRRKRDGGADFGCYRACADGIRFTIGSSPVRAPHFPPTLL